jgi:hypothetical protein
MDVRAGYIGAVCLGIMIGLIGAAVIESRNVDAQARQIMRNWQPRIVRRKDPRVP